ncbi:hypothetical protein [Streptomyces chartreusis]
MIVLTDPKTGDTVEIVTFQMPRKYLEGVGYTSFCVWESWHKQGERVPGFLYSRLWGPTDAFGHSRTLDLAISSRTERGWVQSWRDD